MLDTSAQSRTSPLDREQDQSLSVREPHSQGYVPLQHAGPVEAGAHWGHVSTGKCLYQL